jgi:NAD-dependent protein deacetylase/lipoamidase
VTEVVPTLDLLPYREIAVLTGAGVSAASGLPTYRGPGGLWTTSNVEDYATAAAFARDPGRVWDFFATARREIARAVPNAAHLALASAERRLPPGHRLTVITQNVDRLHSRAGSQRVVELHGTLWKSRCATCSYSREEELATVSDECPACPSCGASMRPDVTLFDEGLPVDAEREAATALRVAELFIAVGTSGTVSPAANFVRSAEHAGARTIFVNLEPMKPANPMFHETYLWRAELLLPRLLGFSAQT